MEPAPAAVVSDTCLPEQGGSSHFEHCDPDVPSKPMAHSTLYHFLDVDSGVWEAEGCVPGWWLVKDRSRMTPGLSGTEFGPLLYLCLSCTALLTFVPCLTL